MPTGLRRNYCPSHAGYRELAAEMADRIARALGAHPALLGWQVDNEIAGDGFTCWCAACERAFRYWLQKRYGSLANLNQVWQSMVWSQWYNAWTQIPLPRPQFGGFAPALKLACRRFRSHNWLAFYRAQATALRRVSNKPVSTNFFNYTWDVPFDLWEWGPELDATGCSHYLEDSDESRFQLALLGGDTPGDKPLWVLEQKAGQQQAQNLLPDDPPRLERHLRLCAQSGAQLAIYWHLRQHSAGCEMEHGAVLRHDGTPGRIAQGIKSAIANTRQLKAHAPAKERLLVFSYEQHWANEQRPPLGSRLNYCEELREWHAAGCAEWGELRIGSALAALENCRLVLAPDMQMNSLECTELLAYVRAGGTLLTTADFARLDTENNVLRRTPLWYLENPPELEILHPRADYALSAELAGHSFCVRGFWGVPLHGILPATPESGSVTDATHKTPLLVALPHGKGRIILLLAVPDAPGKETVTDLLDRLVKDDAK